MPAGPSDGCPALVPSRLGRWGPVQRGLVHCLRQGDKDSHAEAGSEWMDFVTPFLFRFSRLLASSEIPGILLFFLSDSQ